MIEENLLLHSHRHGKSAQKTKCSSLVLRHVLLGLSCKQKYDGTVPATRDNLEALCLDQIAHQKLGIS